MDKIESLSNTLSQITMYDIKSMYNQAKNVVLNVSEMEAKVREATNDDPWGASSTLMQEIAQGTFSFQYFNEIMPCIYARFMEKEARQWRQIYKALQLLEYLIKHGSERVVDDARSHISTLKMLRNFHYIDDKGKDEGINVRNRSRELVELLSDVEKIRGERRKAKANKSKYIGVGNDGFSGGSMSFSSGGSRYGGFGSDSLGGGGGGGSNYSSNDYYNGGGSSSTGGGSGGFSDSRRGVEEYDAGDDEIVSRSPVRATSVRSTTSSARAPTRKATAPTPAPAAPAPVQNLLDFDDDTFGATTPPAPAAIGALGANKALPAVSKPNVGLDDDDFADFQAAPVRASLTGGSPAPASAAPKLNLMDMLNSTSPSRPAGLGQPQQQQAPANFGMGVGMGGMGGMHRPNSSFSQSSQFSSPMVPQSQPQTPNNLFGGAAPMKPSLPTNNSSFSSPSMRPSQPAAQPAKSGATANFDDLWSMSLGSTASKPATGGATGGKSIKDLEKEKAMTGLWGAQKPPGANMNAFGSFGGNAGGASSNGGGDDLLL